MIRTAEEYRGAFACGITTQGEAFCWGANALGSLGIGHPESTEYIDQQPIVATPTRVQTTLRFKSIAVGTSIKWFDRLPLRAVVCAVSMADNLYCWGDNTYGQLGDGTTEMRTSPTRVFIR
jgi:serine/threonine-protein kinase